MDDDIGKKFGYLTVIDIEKIKDNNRTRINYICKCDCGNIKSISKYSIKKGVSNSCGCFRKKKITKHNMSRNELYGTWRLIKRRCSNKRDKYYHNYGGRGITYDKSWENNVEKFIYDIEKNLGKRPLNHSLDRIDNNKGYFIENLRWADDIQQSNNRRKKASSGEKNIHKIHDDCFIVVILRNGFRRHSKTIKNIEHAIKLRNEWLENYQEDPDKWIKETINKKYKRS